MGNAIGVATPEISPLMTVAEVSEYLRTPKSTVLLLIRRGDFSKKVIGKRFLLQRAEIQKYASTGFQRQGVRP
jgi:excisionase family DNA binding protein